MSDSLPSSASKYFLILLIHSCYDLQFRAWKNDLMRTFKPNYWYSRSNWSATFWSIFGTRCHFYRSYCENLSGTYLEPDAILIVAIVKTQSFSIILQRWLGFPKQTPAQDRLHHEHADPRHDVASQDVGCSTTFTTEKLRTEIKVNNGQHVMSMGILDSNIYI